jgi:hypothetical protein
MEETATHVRDEIGKVITVQVAEALRVARG